MAVVGTLFAYCAVVDFIGANIYTISALGAAGAAGGTGFGIWHHHHEHEQQLANQRPPNDRPSVAQIQPTNDGVVRFEHHEGLSPHELEVLGAMTIHPYPDFPGRALFTSGADKARGNFTGAQGVPIDGLRYGHFSAQLFPGLSGPVEGDWIVIIRTEASNETSKQFERLQETFWSTFQDNDLSRMMFEELLNKAALREQLEDEQ